MTTTSLALSAACDRRLVAVEVSSQRTIEWAVQAPDAARPNRAPLNIALVLDRSGSMAGDKLSYVRQAACHVLGLLDERDRVAVVAYDDQVTLVAPGGSLTEQHRRGITAQVEALRPGATTNLSGGWLEGCRAVSEQFEASGVNRVLLLTDGLANCGITDVEELAHHARELRLRGIATSTFGVGLNFNEHLLTLLAEQGGGHFFYLAQPSQIPTVFGAELSELLAVVAREASLVIETPPGLAVELLGDLPHERQGQRLRVFLGDVAAGERRAVYTRILTPPDAPGTSVVLHGELSYANLDGATEVQHAELAFAYVSEAETLLAPIYRELLARSSEVELATATAAALRLERAGRLHEAQTTLHHTLAACAAYAPAPATAAYAALAARMEHGLSEADRKQALFDSYRTRQSRGSSEG